MTGRFARLRPTRPLDPVLQRRVVGTATVVLVLALATLVLDWRYAPPRDSYQVTALLGTAGSGVGEGTDVKVRGVNVGRVDRVRYEDGRAYADLTLDPHPRLPGPDQLELVVTAKTLLGEKQLELSFPDEAYDRPPYLAAGDVLEAAREPTELSEVLDVMEPFLAAIDERELATIVDVLGDQRGEGEAFARNLELGQRLAAFGDRTAPDALDRMRDLTLVADAFADAAPDLTRLNRALPEATGVLTERQADLRANLDAVSRFARTLDRTLDAEEAAISDFLVTQQPVGDVLERNQDQLGSLVEGMSLYARALGSGGTLLDDGTEWAGFRIFVDPERSFDPVKLLCLELEEVFGEDAPAQCEDRR
ncbi:MlaD family protein [Egicoccus sp. AB-alg2]|uniref:MlaD family protein n=1 Tax=Egicoccus sp. AB-alg2 TaxID=3242693 RepID=UPI00359E13F9